MKHISAATRVCFGLVCLSISTWLIAYAVGLFPDRQEAVVRGRAALCENIALHCSLLASRGDLRTIQSALEGLVKRNREVQSAGLRLSNGTLATQAGFHATNWNLPADSRSTPEQMRVPVTAGAAEWGALEVRFHDAENRASVLGVTLSPVVLLINFAAAGSYLLHFLYLRKMLHHLDPSKVIPKRVRQTLDTLAGGLLVLDQHERILMANQSFAKGVGSAAEELIGRRASELDWSDEGTRLKMEGFPWLRAIAEGEPQLDELLILKDRRSS